MKNYIAIRFSLKFDVPGFKKSNEYLEKIDRSKWFAWRADLMKRTLVESILNQTSKVSKVFVFMDIGDRDLYKQYLNLGGIFVPVYCKASALNEKLSQLLLEEGDGEMVLSRIDSDDMISSDYIRSINQDFLLEKNISYMVAAKGYISDLNEIQDVYYNCSPFISIFFPKYEPRAIFFKHLDVLEKKPILNTSAEWMQILHESNVSNKFRSKNFFSSEDKRKIIPGEIKQCNDFWPSGFIGVKSLPKFIN